MSSNPILSTEDAELFFELFIALINFTNQKKNIDEALGFVESSKQLYPTPVRKIADALWSNPELIDEYISENSGISNDRLDIVNSWKNRISSRFFLERHLKAGSILIDTTNKKYQVYQVYGITSSLEEMFQGRRLPVFISATLLPFKNVIITDGIITTDTTLFGQGYRQALKDVYMDAKAANLIHKRF